MLSWSTKIFDAFFKNRKGKLVIWQNPNAPLWGWIIAEIGTRLFQQGHMHNGLKGLGMASLFTWAFLEIQSGESYFRRTLGAAVMVSLAYSFFMTK